MIMYNFVVFLLKFTKATIYHCKTTIKSNFQDF